MSFFNEIEYLLRKRFFYAEYFFEIFFFKIFVIKNKNYMKDIEIMKKQDQFFLYFSNFIKFFFCLIKIFFNDVFHFFKGNLSLLKNYLKKNFLNNIKIKKNFLINDLYNSFSTKVLISSTAFFILYLIVIIFYINLLHLNLAQNSFLFFSKIETKKVIYESFPILAECKFIKLLREIAEETDEYIDQIRIKDIFFVPLVCFSEESRKNMPVIKAFITYAPIHYLYELFAPGLTPEIWLEEFNEGCQALIYETRDPIYIKYYNKIVSQNHTKAEVISALYKVADFYEENEIYKHKRECLEKIIQNKISSKKELKSIFKNVYMNKKELNQFYKNYVDSNGQYYLKDLKIYVPGNLDFSGILNFRLISKTSFIISIFFLINILHTFIAFLSLGYDYLLKKLTLKNILILYFISSTTLQLFFKISFVYFFW
jgi:hypothetical protein